MNELLPWFGIAVSLISAGAVYGAMRSLINEHGKRLDDMSSDIKEVVATTAKNTLAVSNMLIRIDGIVKDLERVERSMDRDREANMRATRDGIKL